MLELIEFQGGRTDGSAKPELFTDSPTPCIMSAAPGFARERSKSPKRRQNVCRSAHPNQAHGNSWCLVVYINPPGCAFPVFITHLQSKSPKGQNYPSMSFGPLPAPSNSTKPDPMFAPPLSRAECIRDLFKIRTKTTNGALSSLAFRYYRKPDGGLG